MQLMKKLILSALAFFCLNNAQAQWISANLNTSFDLQSVDYFSANEIWVGSFNRFYKTSNNGVNWTQVYPMYDTFGAQLFGTMYDVSITGTNSAVCTGLFFLGNDEVILKTNNGGTNWDYASINDTVPLLRYILSVDKSGVNMVAVGNNGRIAKSTNSGNTWTFVSSGTSEVINDVKYFSTDTLFATGENVILKSVNGGNTWSLMNITGSHHSITGSHNVVYVGVEYSSIMKKSVNYGSTFSTINLPFESNGVVYSLGADTVLAAGDEDVYISTTGGQFWEKFNLQGYSKVWMFDFLNANSGIAVGAAGYAIRTNNFSATPSFPIASFNIPGGADYCLGDSIVFANTSAQLPGYTYEWRINNALFSTQYNTGIVLNTAGSYDISLTVVNSNGSTETSSQVTIVGHDLLPFNLVNYTDTVCSGNRASFAVHNTQFGVTYQLRIGILPSGAAQNGNGGTLLFPSAAPVTATTIFNMIATRTNMCYTDTNIEYDTVHATTGFYPTACIPTGAQLGGITNVQLNSIQNASTLTSGAYSDYSCSVGTNLIVGFRYPFTITTGSPNKYCKIWIDLDNNGNFLQANELLYSGYSATNSITGILTIPITFQLFNVPLRLRIGTHLSSNLSACNSSISGEYEDYFVVVITGPSNPVSSFTTEQEIQCLTTVAFTNTTFNANSYLWNFGDGTTSTDLHPFHTYTSSGNYMVQLIAFNGTGSDTTYQSIAIQNPVIPIPASCASTMLPCGGNTVAITYFNIDQQSYNSPFSQNVLYEDFTCTYLYHLTIDSTHRLYYAAGTQNAKLCAWIDYNNDGVFSDTTAERLIPGNIIPGSVMIPYYFTVPNWAVTNTPLRLRISATYSNYFIATACTALCGQYEEYTVIIGSYPYMNVGFLADTTSSCVNKAIAFTNLTDTANAVSYSWNFGDGSTSTLMNPTHSYASTGMYTVTLVACNSNGNCDTLVKTNYISITQNTSQISALGPRNFCFGDSVALMAQPGMNLYQWYRNFIQIPGATSYYYKAKVKGKYFCVSKTFAGCSDTSNTIIVRTPCLPPTTNQLRTEISEVDDEIETGIAVYPNPGNGVFTAYAPAGQLLVYNLMGKLIYSRQKIETEHTFDISNLPAGIYLVTVRTDNNVYSQRIILLRE